MRSRILRWSGWLGVVALALFAGVSAVAGPRGSDDGVWGVPDQLRLEDGGEPWVRPLRFAGATLDQARLLALLERAPAERLDGGQAEDGVVIQLPLPDGTFQRFMVWDSPVMDPALAERYPEIRSFIGQGLDDRSASLRCGWTPMGFHAQVRSATGMCYVDPIWRGDTTSYAAYEGRFARSAVPQFTCATSSTAAASRALTLPGWAPPLTSGGSLRTYRTAIAATGEYVGDFGGTVLGGLAAINVMLARINGIYEAELAVRLVLVPTETNIIFTDGTTDPFTTAPVTFVLTNPNAEAQAAIDLFIGDANYDIGHLVHSRGSGGNAGFIASVCTTGQKGAGFTALNPANGDAFWVDYVAHEIGHQFGGNHTWASCVTQFNEDNPVKYEVGGGTTIMAYAGICGADNLPGQPQPDPGAIAPVGFTDPYFHSGSLDQIVGFTTTGNGNLCAVVTPTGNTPPAANAGADFTIPQGTPFKLVATGSDPDGDPLTFCWEERDPVPNGPDPVATTADNGVIPLFRSFPPTTSGERTFPRLANILSGTLFPAPAALGEQLPTTNRTMNFRVTARDNRAGGGGIATDDMVVTVNAASGPFAVTSPNGGESWGGGTAQTVTWNVAGTSGAPVSTANVNILLSLDGGLTFPTVLAAATPNDGSHVVTLPDCQYISTARVKVEAVGNVYFDISNGNFTMVDVTPPVVTATVTRRVLWPASKGLLKIPLTFSAVDPCGGPTVFDSVTVLSDEGAGVAPYAPDATFVGGVLRLRSERLVPGNGRVYLVVVRFRDGVGNVGAGVASIVVPSRVTVAAVSAALLDAATNQAACLAANGAPPPGYVQVLP